MWENTKYFIKFKKIICKITECNSNYLIMKSHALTALLFEKDFQRFKIEIGSKVATLNALKCEWTKFDEVTSSNRRPLVFFLAFPYNGVNLPFFQIFSFFRWIMFYATSNYNNSLYAEKTNRLSFNFIHIMYKILLYSVESSFFNCVNNIFEAILKCFRLRNGNNLKYFIEYFLYTLFHQKYYFLKSNKKIKKWLGVYVIEFNLFHLFAWKQW